MPEGCLGINYNSFQISIYDIHYQISIATEVFIGNNSTAEYEYYILLEEKDK